MNFEFGYVFWREERVLVVFGEETGEMSRMEMEVENWAKWCTRERPMPDNPPVMTIDFPVSGESAISPNPLAPLA